MTVTKREFSAPIEAGDGGGAYVTIPFDVEQVFGRKRVPVKATLDGEPYRGTLVRMGSECHLLLVRKDIREKIGKTIGDVIRVTVEEDTEERKVVVPDDFNAALQYDWSALAFFTRLSYTHQREYVQWIGEAKRGETRRARIERAVEMLREGKKPR